MPHAPLANVRLPCACSQRVVAVCCARWCKTSKCGSLSTPGLSAGPLTIVREPDREGAGADDALHLTLEASDLAAPSAHGEYPICAKIIEPPAGNVVIGRKNDPGGGAENGASRADPPPAKRGGPDPCIVGENQVADQWQEGVE